MNTFANTSSSSSSVEDDEIVPLDEFELDYNDVISEKVVSTLPNTNRISLPPDYNNSNRITNELFSVTSNLRESYRNRRLTQPLPQPKRLNNNKIEKMLQDINNNKNLEESDYELDDVLRTRIFDGRFKNRNAYLTTRPDLNEYFDENKENRDKPARVGKRKASVLQPITNNLQRPEKESLVRSPKRLCLPKHALLKPARPSLKVQDQSSNIFLIESSTGLINDATKYATELNGSQCEDYPLPEHENEVVQIPTNDDENPKMAIIRMFKSKRFGNTDTEKSKNGFYSETEFDTYKAQQGSGVSVISQSVGNSPEKSKKKVRWATNLEW
ncbi:hypothetical protein G210_3986 [Candida maltosa Xu316]|uniref:Uncharacterized protein n=1 Tax=Candida maltosa (strain Xu316) TaxID=1245528 RepID=M3JSM0_CANMX|nr:hypothetical protein G210_3986 [Candida maltosa Xu316]